MYGMDTLSLSPQTMPGNGGHRLPGEMRATTISFAALHMSPPGTQEASKTRPANVS